MLKSEFLNKHFVLYIWPSPVKNTYKICEFFLVKFDVVDDGGGVVVNGVMLMLQVDDVEVVDVDDVSIDVVS